MRFGLAYDLRNPRKWAVPFNRLYQDFLAQCEVVEALGYDSVWISEHHYSTDDGWIPAGLTLTAAVAARTRRVKIGSWIIALPLHDPVRVAEQVTVLDYISDGRIRLGVALGYRVAEFRAHGIDRSERGGRLDEALEVIRKCWTEESFSYDGRFYKLRDLAFYPKPIQVPHPPIYMGAQTHGAIRHAARVGCHLLPLGGQDAYETYSKALCDFGRNPMEYEFNTMASMYSPIVCTDPDATWSRWKEQIMYRLESYSRWYHEAGDLAAVQLQRMADSEGQLERARRSVMTPEACVAFLSEFFERIPCTEVVLWGCYPGIPLAVSGEWHQLFAHDVMPRLRNAVGRYRPPGSGDGAGVKADVRQAPAHSTHGQHPSS